MRKDKIPVYYTTNERLIIKRCAANAQLSVSEWIRHTTLEHPEYIEEKQFIKQLSTDELGVFKNGNHTPKPFFGNTTKRFAPLFGDPDDDSDEE